MRLLIKKDTEIYVENLGEGFSRSGKSLLHPINTKRNVYRTNTDLIICAERIKTQGQHVFVRNLTYFTEYYTGGECGYILHSRSAIKIAERNGLPKITSRTLPTLPAGFIVIRAEENKYFIATGYAWRRLHNIA